MFRTTLMAIGMIAAFCDFVFSQSIWNDPHPRSGFHLEVLRPQFGDEQFSDPLNLTFFVSGQIRLSDNLFFSGELPLAHTRLEAFSFDFENASLVSLGKRSRSVIGNPYLGVIAFVPNSPVFWELGGRIPRQVSSSLGQNADFDRFEAFYENLWSFQVKLNRVAKTDQNFLSRFRIGPSILGQTEGGEPQVFLDYGLQFGYEGSRFILLGGVTGRMWLGQLDSQLNLDHRSAHQLGVQTKIPLGRIQPGVHFRLLFDDDLARLLDLSDQLKYVVGLSLDFEVQ